MSEQVVVSVVVGLVVSAVCFLPLVLWQYRRYGRFDGARTAWTVTAFVYAAGLVAFTVFPLPDFSEDYCTAHHVRPLLDPLRFPREVIAVVRERGVIALTGDWVVWEFALNMVLFVPFGLIVRRVFEWSRPTVLGAAVGVSILIELTQLTGNWGLAPCPYRFADVTDLATNSAGAVVGIALERLTPRLLSTKAHLLAQRDRARPVTRGRRLLGMMLDAWYLTGGAAVGGTIAAVVYSVTSRASDADFTASQLLELERVIFTGAWAAAVLVALAPAFIGTGASLGQRTVYLRPVARNAPRMRCLVRGVSVQAVVPTLLFAGFPLAILGPVLLTVAVAAVFVDARGISYRLAGLGLEDVRSGLQTPEPARA